MLHLQTTPADAESPESRRALLQALTSRALPSPRVPSPPGLAAPRPPSGPRCPRSARGVCAAPGDQRPGGPDRTGSPAGSPARRPQLLPAPRTAAAAAAPPGGPAGAGPRLRGGRRGAGARRGAEPARSVTSGPRSLRAGRGSSAAPAAPGAPRAVGVSRQRAEGRGDRSSHTRTHTHCGRRRCCRCRGCGSPVLCRSGGSSAQLPPRNGAAVTWGTGTSKVLPLPPLRHTAAAFLLLLPSPPLPRCSRLPHRKQRPRNCSCQQI